MFFGLEVGRSFLDELLLLIDRTLSLIDVAANMLQFG
jgi:hypothetical protein